MFIEFTSFSKFSDFSAHSFVVSNIPINTKQFEYIIYPTPPLGQDMTQGQFLSGV